MAHVSVSLWPRRMGAVVVAAAGVLMALTVARGLEALGVGDARTAWRSAWTLAALGLVLTHGWWVWAHDARGRSMLWAVAGPVLVGATVPAGVVLLALTLTARVVSQRAWSEVVGMVVPGERPPQAAAAGALALSPRGWVAVAFVVLAVTVAGALVALPSPIAFPGRYALHDVRGGIAYRIDRWTGRVDVVRLEAGSDGQILVTVTPAAEPAP